MLNIYYRKQNRLTMTKTFLYKIGYAIPIGYLTSIRLDYIAMYINIISSLTAIRSHMSSRR